jgi:hypothetical protein
MAVASEGTWRGPTALFFAMTTDDFDSRSSVRSVVLPVALRRSLGAYHRRSCGFHYLFVLIFSGLPSQPRQA